MQTVFITSASGHVGSEVVPILLTTQSFRLVLPTSNVARLSATLPKSDLLTVIEGSIQDPQWVEAQLKKFKVSSACICLTGVDELFTTMNLFSAFERTPSMKHIVLLSACGDFFSGSPTLGSWKAAHAIVKYPIEIALRELCHATSLTHTILGPTLFFSNDLRQKLGL